MMTSFPSSSFKTLITPFVLLFTGIFYMLFNTSIILFLTYAESCEVWWSFDKTPKNKFSVVSLFIWLVDFSVSIPLAITQCYNTFKGYKILFSAYYFPTHIAYVVSIFLALHHRKNPLVIWKNVYYTHRIWITSVLLYIFSLLKFLQVWHIQFKYEIKPPFFDAVIGWEHYQIWTICNSLIN